MKTYKTQGIIIGRREWGEADRLLTLFSPTRGKISILAPNSRRPQAILAGQSELFYHLAIVGRAGRSLDKLQSAAIINTFPQLRQSLKTIRMSSACGRLVNRVIQGNQANPALFKLFLSALNVLNLNLNSNLFLAWFYARVLAILGWQPNLEHCFYCQQGISRAAKKYLVIADGGLVCEVCGRHHQLENLLPISDNEIKLWRLLSTKDWKEIARLSTTTAAEQVKERIVGVIRHHLM